MLELVLKCDLEEIVSRFIWAYTSDADVPYFDGELETQDYELYLEHVVNHYNTKHRVETLPSNAIEATVLECINQFLTKLPSRIEAIICCDISIKYDYQLITIKCEGQNEPRRDYKTTRLW